METMDKSLLRWADEIAMQEYGISNGGFVVRTMQVMYNAY
jgi:hypothetical protein